MTQTFPTTVWLIGKLFVLLGLVIYIVFAGVMVRQEILMSKVLEEKSEPLLRVLVLIHLVLSLGLFVLSLLIL
jgi:hypothetical protein